MECLCKISLAEIGELLQLLKEELNVCEWKNTIRLLKKKHELEMSYTIIVYIEKNVLSTFNDGDSIVQFS